MVCRFLGKHILYHAELMLSFVKRESVRSYLWGPAASGLVSCESAGDTLSILLSLCCEGFHNVRPPKISLSPQRLSAALFLLNVWSIKRGFLTERKMFYLNHCSCRQQFKDVLEVFELRYKEVRWRQKLPIKSLQLVTRSHLLSDLSASENKVIKLSFIENLFLFYSLSSLR